MNFIEPFKFPDLDDFLAKFGNMANKDQVEALQRMISPFMLRRVKEDVAKDIPAKEETVIDVELTSIQKQYYRAIFEHNHAFLNLGATRQTVPKLMNIQMELRKVCNHPFLLEGVEHRETERQYKEFQESGKLEGKSPEEQQHMLNEHGYVMTSGKMVLLDKLLPKLRQEGHKVLIFSQVLSSHARFVSETSFFNSLDPFSLQMASLAVRVYCAFTHVGDILVLTVRFLLTGKNAGPHFRVLRASKLSVRTLGWENSRNGAPESHRSI